MFIDLAIIIDIKEIDNYRITIIIAIYPDTENNRKENIPYSSPFPNSSPSNSSPPLLLPELPLPSFKLSSLPTSPFFFILYFFKNKRVRFCESVSNLIFFNISIQQ
jgi:hypothetical protein